MTITTNKQGQALGRKGAESRARLLQAARGLIETTPADRLTASSIARAAELAQQSFYLYFKDVEEVLLSLSRTTAEDTADIVAQFDAPWDLARLNEHVDRFVSAFYDYWNRHRAILHIRNFRADSGQASFVQVRNESTMPIVLRLAERIRAAHAAEGLSERAALARAVIIVAAIERMASRYAVLQAPHPLLDGNDLRRAEVDILLQMLSPPPT